MDRARAVKRKSGYHHGDLPTALMDAAERLLRENGPEGFTMADACRLAGVSTAAPYRHFADRNALLRAVAGRGFARFGQGMQGSMRGRIPGSVEAITAMGVSYVRFAEAHPDLFRLMFGRPPGEEEAFEPKPEGQEAFEVLLRSVSTHLGVAETRAPEVVSLSLHLWSYVHGVASLLIDRDFMAVETSPDIEAMIADATCRILGEAPPSRAPPSAVH